MQTIFFFYGLAFLVMGIVIFLMPKKNDLLGLSEDLWLVGLFGVLHGLNEWVDLCILRGSPFNVATLTVFGALLLPWSFVPLVQFGVRTLFRGTRSFRSLKHLWIILLTGWAVACALSPDFLIPNIAARYFIGFPGTILAAAGLCRAFLKADKNEFPATVFAGAIGAVIFFIFYGILTGLVVPKANFLLASLVNYPNFLQITGGPVQFFRMICAVLLAASFFMLTGIYAFSRKNRKVERRGGIRRKITLWLSAMVFSVFVLFSILGYRLVFQMREETVGEKLQLSAGLIAVSLSNIINHEMENFRVYFSGPATRASLKKINAGRGALSSRERENYFQDMDRKWADLSATEFRQYTNDFLNARLKFYVTTRERLAEVFLTDRYGGLAAASGQTTDFFQADESWWQDTFREGKGRETVRDIAWDESSGVWSLDFAIPVNDGQGAVLGIAKQAMSIQSFFQPLQDYHIGKTGHAVLIDSRGGIIFHQGIKPPATKYTDEKKLKELFQGDRPWAVLSKPHGHKEEMFVAFAKVRSPLLEANGIHWYVFVDQSKKEVFAPLRRIVLALGITWTVFLLIFLGIANILGGRLAMPLRELSRAAEKVREGDWDYSVDVRSTDEIQDLAESFHFMVEHLHQRQTELLESKKEIEALSHGLEAKVEERTRELSESQRATMNILEDLTSAKEELETQAWGLQKANDGIKALYQELEKKNVDLAQLDKLKDDFISIVAHELRNPLGVVREAATLILDGLAGPVASEQKVYIEMVQRTSDRLIHITSDLLDLAKIESGRVELHLGTLDFLSLVRQACEGIALRAHKKGLTVSQDFPGGKIEILGDFDKLSQVMINLLSNAYKFTETGGITAEVRDLGEEVRCAVKDTGPGISEGDLSKLFSKFEQFGKPAAASEKGSGLGLVISKSIIEAHGGRIWVESEPGKGAAFIFIVPKKRERRKNPGE